MTIKFDGPGEIFTEAGTVKTDGPVQFSFTARPAAPKAVLTPEEAARFINEDTTWEPGWKITAESRNSVYYAASNSDTVLSRVQVSMSKQSRNSSYPDSDGGYPQPWTLEWKLGVPDFARASYDALVYWVLEKITWCNEHETREFSRYKKDGQWYAPFHPHRGGHTDQHQTPEWRAQYRDPADKLIAARRPA